MVEKSTQRNHKVRFGRIIIGAICAGIILVSCFIVLILRIMDRISYTRTEPTIYTSGKVDGDGTAHFMELSGKEITVQGNMRQTERTADKKHIVSIDEDGRLILYDGNGEEQKLIDQDTAEIFSVRDNGFVFSKKDELGRDTYYRCLFNDDFIVSLGQGDFVPADDTLDMVVYDDGNIYTLLEEEKELNQVHSYSKEASVELIDISTGGNIAVWAEEEGNIHNIYFLENGRTEKIDQVELEEDVAAYNSYTVYFKNNMKDFVLLNGAFHQLYTKKSGEGIQTIEFGEEWYSSIIYSEEDYFYYDEEASVDDFYLEAGDGENFNVYHVNENEKEKVLSKTKNLFSIRNGTISYTLENSQLYSAKVSKGKVINEKKIASDVYYAELSEDGKHLYYTKDDEKNTDKGELYYSKNGEEGEFIQKNVELYSLRVSKDGKTILYFTDVTEMQNNSETYGNLESYTAGGKVKLIDEDVYRIQPLEYSSIDPNSFGYFKYKEESQGYILCDYYYFDGKSERLVAADVKR